jgi:ABC-type transporter Mla subunit MlaD
VHVAIPARSTSDAKLDGDDITVVQQILDRTDFDMETKVAIADAIHEGVRPMAKEATVLALVDTVSGLAGTLKTMDENLGELIKSLATQSNDLRTQSNDLRAMWRVMAAMGAVLLVMFFAPASPTVQLLQQLVTAIISLFCQTKGA